MKYPAAISLNGLSMAVHLGFGAEERAIKQQIIVDIDLYFSNQPKACFDDGEGFICYYAISQLITKIATERDFQLIEYMGKQFCDALEGHLSTAAKEANIEDVRYRLKLRKCAPPIDDLLGDAVYSFTNLPNGLPL
jgi:FolB domain-containing protein